MPEQTPIQKFYSGRSVFVTGATGFCGKVLIEKLLRCCPDIKTIYVLMRPKKGLSVETRFNKLLEEPVFEKLQQQPAIFHKLVCIPGDISVQNMGVSTEDRTRLVETVSIVFHVAATIRFDESIRPALLLNVGGTRSVVDLCRETRELKALVYVSTAYSHCTQDEIEEKIYSPPANPVALLKCVQWISSKDFQLIEKSMLGNWPNTYTYSKALAEDVVHRSCEELPVAIVRPSIVTSIWRDPVPGWTDSTAGPTMGVYGAAMGMIRCGHVDRSKVADMVPVDVVAGALVAVAWETATHRAPTRVYNVVSGPRSPLSWGRFFDTCGENIMASPSSQAVWYYMLLLCRHRPVFVVLSFLLEMLPAYAMDAIPFLVWGKHRRVDACRKASKFLQLVSFFATHEWTFQDRHVRSLLEKMAPEDRKLFYFDMTQLDWRSYLWSYVQGLRRFMMKEGSETLPQARRRYALLYVIHVVVQLVIIYLLYRFFSLFVSPFM